MTALNKLNNRHRGAESENEFCRVGLSCYVTKHLEKGNE